jgi:hypothetical protein
MSEPRAKPRRAGLLSVIVIKLIWVKLLGALPDLREEQDPCEGLKNPHCEARAPGLLQGEIKS